MPVNSQHLDYLGSLPQWLRARDVLAGEDEREMWWWLCGFFRLKLTQVAECNTSRASMGESAFRTTKTGLKCDILGPKLVAGVGFEPTTFRL